MTEFRVAFEAIFPRSVEDLAEAFYGQHEGVLAERAGKITLAVIREGTDGARLAHELIEDLEALGLCIERVDRDLVDGPEIAARLGVTRQAVNQWAKGTRGSGFPRPVGVPGGRRIWAWGQITEWLEQQGNLHEPRSLTLDEASEVDAFLTMRRNRASGKGDAVNLTWLLASGNSKSHAHAATPSSTYLKRSDYVLA